MDHFPDGKTKILFCAQNPFLCESLKCLTQLPFWPPSLWPLSDSSPCWLSTPWTHKACSCIRPFEMAFLCLECGSFGHSQAHLLLSSSFCSNYYDLPWPPSQSPAYHFFLTLFYFPPITYFKVIWVYCLPMRAWPLPFVYRYPKA